VTAKIIDGKAIAQKLRERLKREVDDLKEKGITPGLAVILVGEDPASLTYVRNKRKACREIGIRSFFIFPSRNGFRRGARPKDRRIEQG